MEENVDFINGVIELFEKREQTYISFTEQIVQQLGATVLAALYDFFEVSYEAITWVEFQLSEESLGIAAIVSYSGDQPAPAIIERLAPIGPIPADKKVTEIRRVLRIGIPLRVVGGTREDILLFLKQQTEKQPTPPEPLETVEVTSGEVTPDYDQPSPDLNLTREQLDQVLYFQQQTKGTKH